MGMMTRIARMFGRARAPAIVQRKYLAARPDRLASGFGLGVSSTAVELRDGLRGLVRHSRHMAQNDDYMRGFLRSCRRNIVGPTGIALQNNARDPSGSLDKNANGKIEESWGIWGRIGTPTVCGRHSWRDVENIVVTTLPRDGNVLIRLYRGAEFGPFGFQLQILDIDQLDIEKSQGGLAGGGYIEAGIEFTALDRPVAYHIANVHPTAVNRGPRRIVRIPAEEIIHLYIPEEPGQAIGVPWAHTALRRMNLMHGYEEASLVNARAGAAKMGFFTREINDDIDPDKAKQLYDDLGDKPKVAEVNAGELETLPAGYDFKPYDPKYPDGEMAPFMKQMLRGAASGLGVAYHTLANDIESTNFSSLHHGVSEERAEWRTLQNFTATHLHGMVFSAWLPMALLTNQIRLPFEKLSKFDAASWKPRGWKAINPIDETKATLSEIQAGLRSPQDAVAERGQDLEEVYEQIAEANQLAEAYGLTFQFPAADSAGTSTVPVPNT